MSIDVPLAAEMYYAGNGAIDFHNRVCCKEVRTEKAIRTHRWDVRTNIGLLSMLFADCWLLYRAARGEKLDLSSSEFFEKLAEELIDCGTSPVNQTRSDAPETPPTSLQDTNRHLHRPTKRHRSGKPKHLKQNNCIVCKKSATYVCHLCSPSAANETFICKSQTGRDCWDKHFKEEHCNVFS